jgi:hypothetical protein
MAQHLNAVRVQLEGSVLMVPWPVRIAPAQMALAVAQGQGAPMARYAVRVDMVLVVLRTVKTVHVHLGSVAALAQVLSLDLRVLQAHTVSVTLTIADVSCAQRVDSVAAVA